MTAINWKTGVSGDWSTAADWTGGGVPNATSDVTIAATGTYTVTISDAEASHSLTLGAAGATVDDTGTLSVGTMLAVNAGTFILDSGGEVSGGTIALGNSGHFAFESGTLSAVTFQAPMTLSKGQSLFVENGLSVTGTGGTGSGSINLAAGGDNFVVLDTETLNNATLNFGSAGDGSLYIDGSGSSKSQHTLTLGSGFTLAQTGGTNYLYGDYYSANGSALVNQGLISVGGGTLICDADGYITGFTNAGVITISGGLFEMEANMVSSGTISTSGSGVFMLGSSSVLSGTVTAIGTGFNFDSGTLSAMTWEGALTLGASQTLFVENGLSVTGTAGTGTGTIGLAAGASLVILDSETLNNATLSFASAGNDYLYIDGGPTSKSPHILTLGSGFTLNQTGGTNTLDGYYNSHNGSSLVNDGLISVSSGTLVCSGDGYITSFTNGGSIAISGGLFDLLTNMVSTGAISTSGTGVFELGSSGSVSGTVMASGTGFNFNSGTLSAVTWQGPLTLGAGQILYSQQGLSVTGAGGTGNGTISLAAGSGILDVQGSETLNNATLSFGSASNGYLYVDAASNGTGQTLTLGSGSALSQTGGTNYIDSGYGHLGGVLVNQGLISVSGGTLYAESLENFINSGTISLSGGSIFDLSQVYKFGSIAGTTLSGTYSISGASVLELTQNATIATLAGNVTLSLGGSTIESYNTSSAAEVSLDSKLATIAATGVLTLGTGRSLAAANVFTDNGQLTLSGGSFTEKSIAVSTTGRLAGSGTVVGTLVNSGTIEASNGSLVLAGALSGTGALQIDAGSALEVKTASSSGETVSFGGVGAVLKIDTPASFASILAGFAPGDVIDVANTAITSVSTSGTSLVAVSASGATTLTLAGALSGEHLGLSADGSGGTDITGYGFAQSAAHTPEPVVLANRHVGDTDSTTVTLTNTATPAAFSEALDASIGSAGGAATASGSFTGLAAGSSNGSGLVVGLATGASGALTGTAVISLSTDGTGIDGSGPTSIGTQLVNVSGAVYAYAKGVVSGGGTVVLANTHVGQAASGFVMLSNGAASNGYSEALDASLSGASSGFSAGGSVGGLAAGASNGTSLHVGHTSSASGTYAGSAKLGLVSDGTAIGDGLGTTTLAGQTVAIRGAAYAYASGTLASGALSLAVVHVGQSDSAALSLSNGAAANGFSEALDAGLANASAGVSVSGSVTGLAAGATDSSSLLVGLSTSASGSFTGTALLALVSDGTGIDGLGTTTLTGQTITVSGIVDNYALAAFQDGSGPAIAGSGTSFAINLGSVLQGSAAEVVSLGAMNAAAGLADLLQGTIATAGGSGFVNSGFGAFSGLGAGQSEHSQGVTLVTSAAGTFSETIVLSSSGTNASGYNGALATETLTVTGTVTPLGNTTYVLSPGANTIIGADGGDVFQAPSLSIDSRDSLTGGAGTNVLQLLGAGLFDIGAPKVFANIPTITAYEGQAAAGSIADTRQTVFLRDGANETLDVVAGTAKSGNTNPEAITIYSSSAVNSIVLAGGTDTVFLANGTDTVVLGGVKNSVTAGGGVALVQATAALASAAVVGTATGLTTLEITNAGTVTLNAADTYVTVKLDGTTKLTLDKLGFITADGSNGHDTIAAGAANQTLIGGAGDALTGFTSGGDMFSGASAALSGDTIKNWTAGDTIDLTDMSASATLSYAGNASSGTLTVSDGTHTSALLFSGKFTAANFSAPVADGHGGALIGYQS